MLTLEQIKGDICVVDSNGEGKFDVIIVAPDAEWECTLTTTDREDAIFVQDRVANLLYIMQETGYNEGMMVED